MQWAKPRASAEIDEHDRHSFTVCVCVCVCVCVVLFACLNLCPPQSIAGIHYTLSPRVLMNVCVCVCVELVWLHVGAFMLILSMPACTYEGGCMVCVCVCVMCAMLVCINMLDVCVCSDSGHTYRNAPPPYTHTHTTLRFPHVPPKPLINKTWPLRARLASFQDRMSEAINRGGKIHYYNCIELREGGKKGRMHRWIKKEWVGLREGGGGEPWEMLGWSEGGIKRERMKDGGRGGCQRMVGTDSIWIHSSFSWITPVPECSVGTALQQ